jgi:hypothetical protein
MEGRPVEPTRMYCLEQSPESQALFRLVAKRLTVDYVVDGQ